MVELRVRGIPIHVVERGPADAPPVVLVHSTGLSATQWRRLIRKLAERHRVIAPDLIGYGKSGGWSGPGPFVTEADLEVVRACLEVAGGPTHLVGHSYGGRLALLAAAEDPARVRSLSLFEPVCFGVLRSTGDTEAIGELRAYDETGRFIDDSFGGSEEWVEAFVDYWSGSGAWRQMSDELRGEFMRSSRKMFEEVRETTLDSVPHTHYLGLEMPTLLMSGEASTLAGRRCCTVLEEILPNARHHEIEDAGHLGPVLCSHDVNALILGHIAAVES